MIRKFALTLAFGTLALAGCDEPRPAQEETAPPPMEAPLPPPVEVPPANTEPPSPTDNSTLPADQRASEETVKPESETLFY